MSSEGCDWLVGGRRTAVIGWLEVVGKLTGFNRRDDWALENPNHNSLELSLMGEIVPPTDEDVYI